MCGSSHKGCSSTHMRGGEERLKTSLCRLYIKTPLGVDIPTIFKKSDTADECRGKQAPVERLKALLTCLCELENSTHALNVHK